MVSSRPPRSLQFPNHLHSCSSLLALSACRSCVGSFGVKLSGKTLSKGSRSRGPLLFLALCWFPARARHCELRETASLKIYNEMPVVLAQPSGRRFLAIGTKNLLCGFDDALWGLDHNVNLWPHPWHINVHVPLSIA
jgi:hypothetical protein